MRLPNPPLQLDAEADPSISCKQMSHQIALAICLGRKLPVFVISDISWLNPILTRGRQERYQEVPLQVAQLHPVAVLLRSLHPIPPPFTATHWPLVCTSCRQIPWRHNMVAAFPPLNYFFRLTNQARLLELSIAVNTCSPPLFYLRRYLYYKIVLL